LYEKEEDDEIGLFNLTPTYTKVYSWVLFYAHAWLGVGGVASLAIIQVVHS